MDDGERSAEQRLSRGLLIKRGGAMAVATAVGVPAALPAEVQAERLAADQLKTLSAAEAATLEAVLERLIPSDATGPGAKEANVLRYVDGSLAGDLNMFRAPYAAALQAIDAYSTAKFGAAFAALQPAQQDAVLADMQQNKATGFNPTSTAVFAMLRTHAVQGMFGDPAHGGNVGFVGWKLVRFPGPRLDIPARDQRLDVVPKSNMASTYEVPLFKNTARRT
jgi:gluconate 2-dehydrogenase gamma chain